MDLNCVIKNITFVKYLKFTSWFEYYKQYVLSEIKKDYLNNDSFLDFSLVFKNNQKLFVPKSCFGVLREIFSLKCYDFEDDFFLKNKFNLLDCGSNVGYLPAYYSFLRLKFKPTLVEPDPNNYLLIKKNLINSEDYKLLKLAVADKKSRMKLFLHGSVGNSLYPMDKTSDFIFVNVVKFDSLGIFDVIKFDIEGSEHNIILNQNNWKYAKYLMIEFHGSDSLIIKSKKEILKYFIELKNVYGVFHFKHK